MSKEKRRKKDFFTLDKAVLIGSGLIVVGTIICLGYQSFMPTGVEAVSSPQWFDVQGKFDPEVRKAIIRGANTYEAAYGSCDVTKVVATPLDSKLFPLDGGNADVGQIRILNSLSKINPEMVAAHEIGHACESLDYPDLPNITLKYTDLTLVIKKANGLGTWHDSYDSTTGKLNTKGGFIITIDEGITEAISLIGIPGYSPNKALLYTRNRSIATNFINMAMKNKNLSIRDIEGMKRNNDLDSFLRAVYNLPKEEKIDSYLEKYLRTFIDANLE